MSALRIIVGYPGPSSENPFPVYVGPSGSAAQAAMAQSSAHRFEVFGPINGIRKSNPHAAANAAREAAEKSAAEAARQASASAAKAKGDETAAELSPKSPQRKSAKSES